MTVTDDDVDAAATMLALAASSDGDYGLYQAADGLGYGRRSVQIELAAQAFAAAWPTWYDKAGNDGYEFACAEGEALLRTGWLP